VEIPARLPSSMEDTFLMVSTQCDTKGAVQLGKSKSAEEDHAFLPYFL